jgi:hypothetical protein
LEVPSRGWSARYGVGVLTKHPGKGSGVSETVTIGQSESVREKILATAQSTCVVAQKAELWIAVITNEMDKDVEELIVKRLDERVRTQ